MAMRLKLVMALGEIPGDASAQTLRDLLANAAEPTEADYLCRLAGQRKLPEAAAILASLAEDSTAPMPIRMRAVWALGNYRDATARECLERLMAAPEKYFAVPGQTALPPEAVEQARLLLALAQLRQGNVSREAELTAIFVIATPASQVGILRALAEIKRDHPVISLGLKSSEFAVLQSAVGAALAADPKKYRAALQALRQQPFIDALVVSGLDIGGLPGAFDQAVAPAEKSVSKK